MKQIIDYLNPYAYAMRLRRMMYSRGWLKSYHAGIPVISVGNLTMGGTGKSPLVLLITEYLYRERGKRVAILSRGYKRQSKGFLLVRNGGEILATVERCGDEARMLTELAPFAMVIVDDDRVRGAWKAKQLGAEVIVLDDGYQHIRLKRDLNILLIPAGFSPVIPFGRSREPASATRDADLLITSLKSNVGSVRSINPLAQLAVIRTAPESFMAIIEQEEYPLSEIRGKRILAVSSIANPERFYEMIRELGADVISRDLGDHAAYTASIAKSILAQAEKQGVEIIITTAKDAVKSREYYTRFEPAIPILILRHTVEFLDGGDGFYNAIDKIL